MVISVEDIKRIRDCTKKILGDAVILLPHDAEEALEKAYQRETNDLAKTQLKTILDNKNLAKKAGKPMCQDTGVPLFFVGVGGNSRIKLPDIEDGIIDGVRAATEEVPLRPNAVHPLTRENPGTNVGVHMPYINYAVLRDVDYVEITAFPKGAGSENMSRLAMLTPSHGIEGIKEFIITAVAEAMGNPCPPTIVGVGIGGSADIAMKLAKMALLRPLDKENDDPQLAELEKELYTKLNSLGVGPMGMGGDTTVLGVRAKYAYCHTASLPVALAFHCWAARQKTARIYPDRIEYL
jgi:fumarate hydratase subunit alpha